MTDTARCDDDALKQFQYHWCFRSGRWIVYRDLKIPVDDLGFRQGVTAVERLRTYGGRPFQVAAHLHRWQHTTDSLRIAGLPAVDQIERLIGEALLRNQALLDEVADVGITILATPGTAVDSPFFVIHLNELDHSGIRARQDNGQPLVITDVQQPSARSWPRSIKVRSRIHYYLADLEARQRAKDGLGLLVDANGHVTETSIANIAIVKASRIASPPAKSILGGITQAVIEQIAAGAQIEWEKRPLAPNDLHSADEIFLMGTDAGIWFASSVDGRGIGADAERPVYTLLAKQFRKLTD